MDNEVISKIFRWVLIYTNTLLCSCITPPVQPYTSQEEEEEEGEKEDEGPYAGEENAAQFQFYGRQEESEIMVGTIWLVCLSLTYTAFSPPQSPFHEFPEDDPFAEVQDTGIQECEDYKKKVAAAQKKLNEEGRVVNGTIADIEKQIDVYEKDQKKSCDLKCETGNDCWIFVQGRDYGITIVWSSIQKLTYIYMLIF